MTALRYLITPSLLLLFGCATAQESPGPAGPGPGASAAPPAFQAMDANGDGGVSPGEAEEPLASHFALADEDGDGVIDPVEFSTFDILAGTAEEAPPQWRKRPMDLHRLPERWRNSI